MHATYGFWNINILYIEYMIGGRPAPTGQVGVRCSSLWAMVPEETWFTGRAKTLPCAQTTDVEEQSLAILSFEKDPRAHTYTCSIFFSYLLNNNRHIYIEHDPVGSQMLEDHNYFFLKMCWAHKSNRESEAPAWNREVGLSDFRNMTLRFCRFTWQLGAPPPFDEEPLLQPSGI
jgi:hypothetical protein